MSKRKKRIGRLFNSHFTTVVSISLVLFLVGVGALLLLLSADLAVFVKENLSFSIVLDAEAESADVARLQKTLDAAPYTKSVQYITREQALQELTAALGENPEDFVGYNPLLASLEVKLNYNYANPDSIAMIERDLSRFSQIREVRYPNNLIEAVNRNVAKIMTVLLALVALLLIISFALISNTVRLSIYARRFLIHTMKLVGANWGFIRRPFVWRSVLCGVIASLIAMGALTLCIWALQEEWHDILSMSGLVDLLIVYGVIFVVGFLLTFTSSYLAVTRYLRLRGDDLYYL